MSAKNDRHIESFRALKANWDSYGADAFNEETIQAALRMSKRLGDEWKVVPVADGRISFYRGDEDEVIEVYGRVAA